MQVCITILSMKYIFYEKKFPLTIYLYGIMHKFLYSNIRFKSITLQNVFNYVCVEVTYCTPHDNLKVQNKYLQLALQNIELFV